MAWEYNGPLFPQAPFRSLYSPGIATYDGSLYVLWQDKDTNQLLWAHGTPGNFSSPLPFNTECVVSSKCAPSLTSHEGTLHAIFAEEGGDGYLFHSQFDLKCNRWKHRAGVGLTSEFAPALVSIDGLLLCVARRAGAAVYNELHWAIWHPELGWSKSQPVIVAGEEPETSYYKPAFVPLYDRDIRLLYTPFVDDDRGRFSELRFNLATKKWARVATTLRNEIARSGCDGVAFPSRFYGFIAYASSTSTSSSYSVSVLQYNNDKWQNRESLGHSTTDTPCLAILASDIYCLFVAQGDGTLVSSQCGIDTRTSCWMEKIPDDTDICNLSIPGTHDSAATMKFIGNTIHSLYPFVETQMTTISQQLNLGIRFLDLRLSLQPTGLRMVHSTADLGQPFSQVVDALDAFLSLNKSETILVTIKNDTAGSDPVTFENAVAQVLEETPKLWYHGETLPTLEQCRGRVVLFRRYPITKQTIGFDLSSKWVHNGSFFEIPVGVENTLVVIQDNFNFILKPQSLQPTLDAKWASISTLIHAAQNKGDTRTLFFNFISATAPPLYEPLKFAIGGFDRPQGADQYTFVCGENHRLLSVLLDAKAKKQDIGRLGILLLDFPEIPAVDLVNVIIQSNF